MFSDIACVLVRLRANMKWENVNSIIWSTQHSDGRGLAVLFLEVTGCSMFYNHESGNHVSALLVFSLVFYFVKGGAILSVRGVRGQRWVYYRSRVVILTSTLQLLWCTPLPCSWHGVDLRCTRRLRCRVANLDFCQLEPISCICT